MLKILKYLLLGAYVAGFISGAYIAADVANADTGTTIPADCAVQDGEVACEDPETPCTEDLPCWDCTSMGNGVCGFHPDYPAPNPPDYPVPATPVVAPPAFTG